MAMLSVTPDVITYPTAEQHSVPVVFQNLLNNIASNDVLGLVARAALFFQLTCIYPQLAYIVRIQLFSVLFASSWPRCDSISVPPPVLPQ